MDANTNQMNQNKDNQEIELNLGLSLGGRFGAEPTQKRKTKLGRSSSLVTLGRTLSLSLTGEDIAPLSKEELAAEAAPPVVASIPLMKATSLPSNNDDLRKRKEEQSFRRMLAKRRMLEKNVGLVRYGGGYEEEEVMNRPNNSVMPSIPPMRNWVAGAAGGNGLIATGQGIRPLTRQGSSLGTGSSAGIRESENLSVQGSDNGGRVETEVGSPPRPPRVMDNFLQQAAANANGHQAAMRGEVMPTVFTQSGPEMSCIRGLLYRYADGSGQVRIVCTCHGSFFSPAEFVRHAGGRDVANPLRHIIVGDI